MSFILEEAKRIAQLSHTASLEKKEEYLEQAQNILLEHLKNNPQDTDGWLLLTRIECNAPFYDPYRIIEYSNSILAYDPTNVYALLFLSYADYYLMGNENDELYDKLCMAQSDTQQTKSMIEIAKARYFEFRNTDRFEQALKKSIEYCHDFKTNFFMLGVLYLKQENIEGLALIKQAIKNIKQVGLKSESYDPTDMKDFLNEFFAGTIVGSVEYEQLQKITEVL